MNSLSFEDKEPEFTRLKPRLALRLLSKGLFYIKAMKGVPFLFLNLQFLQLLELLEGAANKVAPA